MCYFRDKPNSILEKIYTTAYRAPHSTSHEVLGQKLPKQVVTEDNELICFKRFNKENMRNKHSYPSSAFWKLAKLGWFSQHVSCVLHGHGKEPPEGVEPDRKGSVVPRPLRGTLFSNLKVKGNISGIYMQKQRNCLWWYGRKYSIVSYGSFCMVST